MATSWRNKKNYPLGVGALNAGITNSGLSIVLQSGQGANFPSASFTVTIDNEIILIDSRSTDTLTVNASGRGYDGTTAAAHNSAAGVYQYQIVKDFTDIETGVNNIENGVTTLAKITTSGNAVNTLTLDNANTNTVDAILGLYHTTSGSAASGIGAKLIFGAENGSGNPVTAAEIHGYLSTVTGGTEQSAWLLRLMNSGSLQDALAVSVGSNSATVGSNQTTVNLWNTNATTVNAFGACTTGIFGADNGSTSFTFRGSSFNFGPVNTNGDVSITVTEMQNNSNPGYIMYRKARYSSGPAQVQASDYLGAFYYAGYTNGSAYSGAAAAFRVQAVDTFTTTAQGTQFTFEVTPSGAAAASRFAALTITGVAATFAVGLAVNANSTFGNANTQTFTFTGRMIVRSVTDAGPMTATAGTVAEIVYNTSNSKFYGCTASGSPATWSALN